MATKETQTPKNTTATSDTANAETTTTEQQAVRPEFGIQQVLVKDVSFETPLGYQLPIQNWQPEIDVELNAGTSKLADNLYQVQLAITVTAKWEDKTAFLVEVKQVGIFGIKNFSDPQLHRMLGSYCPGILFPYARELISDMVMRGGFPPLYLAPINFDVLYEQQLQKQQAEQQQQPITTTSEIEQ
ncbi:MAG: protein-export protein SecB [Gammaproteobacteria bacterium]|jgi:preprotein translocase subunit SecB|nr:protein-export protein SecB [Gammaproteobacteria bacterium]